jgi:hypothetical protein
MAFRMKVVWWTGVPVVLLLLAGALAYTAYLSLQASAACTVVFPNGSRLTVLGTSLWGQPFTTQKPWQTPLQRWLPAKWHSWLPQPFTAPRGGVGSMYSNSLAVWFTYVDARGSNVSARIGSGSGFAILRPTPGSWTFIAAEAADGFRFGPVGGSDPSVVAVGPRGLHLNRLFLDHYPRRQREFDLLFFDADKHLMGSVRVPSPVKGSFPEWTPERLPIVRTNGPLVITLQSLVDAKLAPRRTPFDSGRGPDQHRWSESRTMGIVAQFRLQTADPDWQQAYLAGSEGHWSDATGNLQGPLDDGENAWKLSVAFRRSELSHYPETERLVVSGFSAPQPGEVQVLTNEFEQLGIKFKLRFLAAAGTLAITNTSIMGFGGGDSLRSPPSTSSAVVLRYGRNGGNVAYSGPEANPATPGFLAGEELQMWTMTRPFFVLEAGPQDPLEVIRFRVVASDGQELLPYTRASTVLERGSRSAPKNVAHVVELDRTNVTGTFSLEVILDRARTFEFFVNPKDVKRAAK